MKHVQKECSTLSIVKKIKESVGVILQKVVANEDRNPERALSNVVGAGGGI